MTSSDPSSSAVETQSPDPAPAPTKSLGRLALRGSVFEILGYGGAQALRLGSNIILSHLLFPQAFGLMALVNVFNQGLWMLSDIGIEPAVIQSKRGDEPIFLNTAWTLQVVRGVGLYAVAAALAWPLSVLFKEPQLLPLVLVGSVAVAIVGLHSTSLYTLRRRLSVGTITLIELGSQCAALLVMIPWAYFVPTVWALVGGMVASALVKVAASHAVSVGYHNKLAWDLESRTAIAHFGRWIFGASALNFLSRQADRLVLGRLLGIEELGVYAVAVTMSDAFGLLAFRLSAGILFPALSRVKDRDEQRFGEVYYRARLALDALLLPALGLLATVGHYLIHLLYDDRYAGAGWMLEALAVRVALYCIVTQCENALVSLGQTKWGLYQNMVRLLWIALAMPLGWHFWGLRGLVWAAVLIEVPAFFVLWPPFARMGLLRPLLELRALALFLAGFLPGLILTHYSA